MIPAAFDYVRAESADHAISLLGQHGDEAKLIAGGHSLLPLMKLRLATPAVLIDVGRLTDLDFVRDGGDHVAVGALTRHHDVGAASTAAGPGPDPGPRRRSGRRPAGPPPRHHRRLDRPRRPGLGPAGRDARARRLVRGPRAARTASAHPGPTSSSPASSSRRSNPTELLTEIRVPKVPGAGWSFQKFNRRAQDWAIVGVAAVAATAAPASAW